MMVYLRELMKTEDAKILFVLSLIAIAMIIDFLLGVFAARIKKEFRSEKGILGLLRKIGSILFLAFLIPVSVILPQEIGTTLIYTFYIGYLLMELSSIVENLKRIGVNVSIFEKILGEIHEKTNVRKVHVVEIDEKTNNTEIK